MNALLIKAPWIYDILEGRKTWELRGNATKRRGTIALVESGTGHVVGVCEIVDVKGPLSIRELEDTWRKHGIKDWSNGSRYSRTYGWVLANARALKKPVPYKHPSGAVIWVKLNNAVEQKIKRNDPF
jgi:ASCH domain-containing protein